MSLKAGVGGNGNGQSDTAVTLQAWWVRKTLFYRVVMSVLNGTFAGVCLSVLLLLSLVRRNTVHRCSCDYYCNLIFQRACITLCCYYQKSIRFELLGFTVLHLLTTRHPAE